MQLEDIKKINDRQLSQKFPKLFHEIIGGETKHYSHAIMSNLHNAHNQEEWDDIQRYKDNQCEIKRYNCN